jgi:hypothetical protein
MQGTTLPGLAGWCWASAQLLMLKRLYGLAVGMATRSILPFPIRNDQRNGRGFSIGVEYREKAATLRERLI